MSGVTAAELGGLLDPTILLSLGLSLVTAQMMIGWVMWSLPIPGGRFKEPSVRRFGYAYDTRSKVRSFGRMMIEDVYVNVFVLTVFSGPNLVLSLVSELGWGSAAAAYENLYASLGIGCCSVGSTAPLCVGRGGLCGVPTGAGLLAQMLAGYRYAFWSAVTAVLVLIAVVIGITIVKALVPLIVESVIPPVPGIGDLAKIISGKIAKMVVEFAGSMVTIFAQVSTAMSLLVILPILIFIPFATYLIYGIYFLAKFIQVLWPLLLSLGGFLYGLPARFGRKWGAVLIATTLVLYVGLPFMPVFVNSLSSTQEANANLQKLQQEYDKALYYLMQGSGADVTFHVAPRLYGPGGDPYMSAPDFARIQLSTAGAPDRYLWTDGTGTRQYFLPPGTYTVKAAWWHGVPVTFNGTETTFTIIEEDIKVGRMKFITLTADVYSFRFTMGGNSGTIFFPVGWRMWGDAWSNARVYSMELDETSVSFTFYADVFIISGYQFFMFVQQNVAYTDLLDGALPGLGVKMEVRDPHFNTMWTDGTVYRYRGIVVGLHGGYHTFRVNVNSVEPAPPVPAMEDEDPYALDKLQNPMLPKPDEAQARSLGLYYASTLMLPVIFVYVVLVGLAAGIARTIKGRTLI